MKTFIIGLFSLTLLASGAARAADLPRKDSGPVKDIAAGVAAVCNANGGIVVIIVTYDGKFLPRKCKKIGKKEITKESSVPADTNEFVTEGTLGMFVKTKGSEETDPCYQWTVDGESHVFCW